jgi:flagellar hook-associated protein 2
MAISSTGVGSGLDVKSIVTQLVAIEKQPLQPLQAKATVFQTQLSLYGKIKSLASALGDAAALLAGASGWNAQKASSSNAAAVSVTADASAVAAALSVSVGQLARAQSSASVGVAAGVAVGATGSLNIEMGSWSNAAVPVFTPAGSSIPPISIAAGDTVSAIAGKINAANAGVTATVLRDGANERLVIRSATTGEAAGFRLNTPADAGLAALGFTNPSDVGPAPGAIFVGQTALNAKVTINGVAVVSATNTMTNAIPGVTLQLSQVTTAPVEITVANDADAVKKNIQGFVDAYNALNQTLADATKYTAATKTGGPLQGDATTMALQNTLRAILGSSSAGSTFSRLSEVGIERQTDGSLKVNATKLASAQLDLPNLKNLFATNNNNAATNGFGLKVRDFSRGLVASDGSVSNKSKALQGSINSNTKDQDRVNERASRVEAQLYRQYSALDTQMAKLNGLNSYVTAQLAVWNKPA